MIDSILTEFMAFRVVTPCSVVTGYQGSGGSFYNYLQGRNNSEKQEFYFYLHENLKSLKF